jgi:hypothetical protein
MALEQDVRVAQRKKLRAKARVVILDIAQVSGRTVDISQSGVSIVTDNPIVVGEKCAIMVDALIGGETRQIQAEGKAVYSICVGTDGFRTGFQFTKVDTANLRLINSL